MPCVEFYLNRRTSDVVICSFVFCKELGIGNTPTGPLKKISLDEFKKTCVDIVESEFKLFYTREYGIKSELYNEMSKVSREKFLVDHAKVIVSWPIETKPVNIYVGREGSLYGKVDYPLDRVTFPNYILEAFTKAT